MIALPGNMLITANGNNLVIKGDLGRRTLVARLDPKVERPELQTFDYDPKADAKARRPELVAAVLTVLCAYHVAGRPDRPPPLANFENWSDLVRGALMWLQFADPVKTMERTRRKDPLLQDVETVLVQVLEGFGLNRQFTVPELIRKAGVAGDWSDKAHAGLRAALEPWPTRTGGSTAAGWGTGSRSTRGVWSTSQRMTSLRPSTSLNSARSGRVSPFGAWCRSRKGNRATMTRPEGLLRTAVLRGRRSRREGRRSKASNGKGLKPGIRRGLNS